MTAQVEEKEPSVSHLGQFKLKDREDRRAVRVTFNEFKRKIKAVYIQKVIGETNKIEIIVEFEE